MAPTKINRNVNGNIAIDNSKAGNSMGRKITIFVCVLGILITMTAGCTINSGENENTGKWEKGQLVTKDFLTTEGEIIKNEEGEEIVLRGTNAGGWLVQEFWMCPTQKTEKVNCQKELMQIFAERFGKEKADELITIYEDNYWIEKDFDNCKELGMNVLRLPFTYMNFLNEDGSMRDDAFARTDWFVEEAGKRGIYVILDMHGAQGSQNEKDHSGDTTQGAAFFYGDDKQENQTAYIDLWVKIAEHYKGNPIVAAYDLLNEPYCDLPENTGKTCWDIYDRAYKAIREVDDKHIIIMEAKWDPANLPNPKEYGWTNVMYEYHQYNYTDQHTAKSQLEGIQLKLDLADYADYGVPTYIGETSFFDNTESWELCLNEMNKRNCSYTTWTYKVTGNGHNSWGIYNTKGETVNPETDSYEIIKQKWSNQSDMVENEDIKELLEKYFTGYFSEDK